MTETTDATEKAPKKRTGGLNAMLLADLKAMATSMGIQGAGAMKKAQLVEAIKSAQAGAGAPPASRPEPTAAAEPQRDQPAASPAEPPAPAAEPAEPVRETVRARRQREAAAKAAQADQPEQPSLLADRDEQATRRTPDRAPERQPEPEATQDERPEPRSRQDERPEPRSKQDTERSQPPAKQREDRPEPKAKQREDRPEPKPDRADQGNQSQGNQGNQDADDADGEGRTGRNRRRRGRDRNRAGQPDGQPGQAGPSGSSGGPQSNQTGGHAQQGGQQGGQGNQGNQGNQQGGGSARQGNRHEPDTTILEDDIIVPAAGILDVLDNYAFVRTSGYLAGSDDVYLSLSMVRKFGLRRGDAIAGQVRHPREGERREKFNPMVRIDSVNGQDPDTAKTRADFVNLTPLSPSERLRLETGAQDVAGRLVDVLAPLGKGQRGLIVSPAKAGRTTLLQSVAASISANNPECHLMVVLIDERPEEVTDFERSVKGEVIASTFDRAPVDHTTVAELAVERAKRLVELGHDVVILFDGLTRLGRAYHLALPPSGRTLSGVVDAAALHPTKRFFGAARNVENGGSLTILATLLADTGSATDQVLFEELRDTANMEVRLSGELAERRVFPAVDVIASGTRRDELFLGEQEAAIVRRLRRALSALDGRQALEQLLERLRSSQSNIELLTQVQRTTPAGAAGQEN